MPDSSDTQHHSEMLGQQLRGLAADGIVVRTAYAQVPPRVEYV
jgi:DNA-binding HxlR family transcriptional regulator